MRLIERLSWAMVAGVVGYVAYANDSAEIWSVLFAPVFVALWYVTVCGRGSHGERPEWGAVVLSGITIGGLCGLQCWSLNGYSPRIWGAHVGYLMVTGALFGAVALRATCRERLGTRVLGFALSWVVVGVGSGAVEWGSPLYLSASWVGFPALVQPLALGGPWLMDGLIAAVGACLGEALLVRCGLQPEGRSTTTPLQMVGRALAILAVVGGLGAVRVHLTEEHVVSRVAEASPEAQPVAAVQAAVPGWFQQQARTWDRLRDISTGVYRTLVEREQPWLEGQRTPWLILPESVVFGFLGGEADVWDDVLDFMGPTVEGSTYMTTVTSISTGEADTHRYRFLVGRGTSSGRLAALGESGKSIATPISDRGYRFSTQSSPLHAVGSRTVGAMICWDSMFTTLGMRLARGGADVLVVTANTAGFLRSDGPGLHARMSRMRAVETGVPMVFVSQAGPSFVADGIGRVAASQPHEAQGSIHAWIEPGTIVTPYRYTGRLWLLLATLGLLNCLRNAWAEETR